VAGGGEQPYGRPYHPKRGSDCACGWLAGSVPVSATTGSSTLCCHTVATKLVTIAKAERLMAAKAERLLRTGKNHKIVVPKIVYDIISVLLERERLRPPLGEGLHSATNARIAVSQLIFGDNQWWSHVQHTVPEKAARTQDMAAPHRLHTSALCQRSLIETDCNCAPRNSTTRVAHSCNNNRLCTCAHLSTPSSSIACLKSAIFDAAGPPPCSGEIRLP
jgi:hypothetical protein